MLHGTTFDSFQAACDWIDDNTSPENAGAFVIEKIAPQIWTIQLFATNKEKQCNQEN